MNTISIRRLRWTSLSLSAQACVAILLLSSLSVDAEAYGRRGHHHGHGPSVSVFTRYHYPPYPYHQYIGSRHTTVVHQQSEVEAYEPLYVYPQQGQTASEQNRDEYECYRWAVAQTGFDPVATATGAPRVLHSARAAPANGLPNDPVTGTVGGAALGAAGGALAGDAGTGAAVGAAVGLVAGMIGQANQRQARTLSTAPAPSASSPDYQRAYSTCLTAKGYQVG